MSFLAFKAALIFELPFRDTFDFCHSCMLCTHVSQKSCKVKKSKSEQLQKAASSPRWHMKDNWHRYLLQIFKIFILGLNFHNNDQWIRPGNEHKNLQKPFLWDIQHGSKPLKEQNVLWALSSADPSGKTDVTMKQMDLGPLFVWCRMPEIWS